MRPLFLSIILTFLLIPGIAQDSAADLGVAAIGLVVSDIEASEKFYTEVIGMIPTGSFDLSSEWSNQAGAANGKPFSVKMFKMLDKNSATILKLAYFDKVAPRPPQSGVNSFAGVNYITLNYSRENFQNVVKRLDQTNIQKLGWVKSAHYQLIFIRDPDGVFVELVGPADR